MYKIISTTDKKFVGSEIDISPSKIILPDGGEFIPEVRIPTSNGFTLKNSNYIIVVEEVK